MASGVHVQIQGMRQLRDKMSGRFMIAVDAEAQQILVEAADVAQKAASNAAPRDLGTMARDIHVEARELSVSVISDSPGSYVQEFGRSAGARPPSTDHIAGWVSRHFASTNMKRTTFIIAQSIGRKGFKGKFFMAKGAKEADTYVRARLARASARLSGYWSGP